MYKFLISRLPLHNKVLFHLRFLKPNAEGEFATRSLRYIRCFLGSAGGNIANALPQVIPPTKWRHSLMSGTLSFVKLVTGSCLPMWSLIGVTCLH
ncbi:unnamed protein product [Ixodes persulcatus]